jgi:ACS family glucarate transporter-like MFS transporter
MIRFIVLAWLCLAATIAYIDRNCIAVAEETMRRELHLSVGDMGLVMSAFFVTYAAFQIPSGWICHHWGTRRVLPLFSVLWSLPTGMMALASGLPALLAARLTMGAAQAGIFPACTHTVTKWFPITRRALASGWLGAFMSIGGVVGAALMGVLLDYMSWRWIFALFALPGIIWAVWFYVWFREEPDQHAAVNAAELDLIHPRPAVPATSANVASEATPWEAILTSWPMACICCQQFFRAAGYMFFGSWFATYLKMTHGVSTDESGWMTGLPLWGVVLGNLVSGTASDWILARTGSRRLSRQVLSIVSLLICAGLILSAYAIGNVWLAVLLISAGSFWAAFSAPCAYAITIDMGGKHVAPIFSLMNMSGNIGAVLFPSVVPYLVNMTGSWDAVLFLFAGIYLAAAFWWLLLNPDGTIGQNPLESQ